MAPESFASLEEKIGFLNGYLAAFATLNTYTNHVSSFTLEQWKEEEEQFNYVPLSDWNGHVKEIVEEWFFENIRFNPEIITDQHSEDTIKTSCVSDVLEILESIATTYKFDLYFKFPKNLEPNQSDGVLFLGSEDKGKRGVLFLLNHWD